MRGLVLMYESSNEYGNDKEAFIVVAVLMYLKIKGSRERTNDCHQKSFNFKNFSKYPVSYHDKSTK